MIYDWFKTFNKAEFEALGIPSKVYEYFFTGIGRKEVMATSGNYLSVLFDDIFLTINLNDKNPFEFEDYAIYLDDNDDVWIGIAVED